jgi:hypothetical protein
MYHRFWRFVSQPPVRIMEATDEAEGNSDPVTLETPRFMAVVWGAGGQGDGPTTIVQLDGHGEGMGISLLGMLISDRWCAGV